MQAQPAQRLGQQYTKTLEVPSSWINVTAANPHGINGGVLYTTSASASPSVSYSAADIR